MTDTDHDLWMAYRLRWKRRRLLFRAFRSRHQLKVVKDRTRQIGDGDILAFCCLRDEAERLPHYLRHYRRLGVRHFLVVDNGSTDGSDALLAEQPDVSVWHTSSSYKQSRFGVDWLGWLQMRFGHGHWCLTADADETLIYPHWETRDLRALTGWLDRSGIVAYPAMMLDLYPKGPVGHQSYVAGQDPTEVLNWFDGGNYTMRVQEPLGNLWIQGGARARFFFAEEPRKAPTLTKIPLVKWNRRFAYVNSSHTLLPPRLNRVYDQSGGEAPSGILLHSKFLPGAVDRARVERERREHFARSEQYDSYYAQVIAGPDLWCSASSRFTGWRQLEAMGLMSRGGWL